MMSKCPAKASLRPITDFSSGAGHAGGACSELPREILEGKTIIADAVMQASMLLESCLELSEVSKTGRPCMTRPACSVSHSHIINDGLDLNVLPIADIVCRCKP